MYPFKFAYPWILAISILTLAIVMAVKICWPRQSRYKFPLTSFLALQGLKIGSSRSHIIFALRSTILLLCCLLASRPQWVDTRSKVDIEGVDMVLALDISGSMEIFDDLHDRRPRIQVAKEEAINFIHKRTNDPIGLVVFATDTLSLAPPTLDKSLLQETIEALEIGFVNPNETALAQGLSTAISRLRHSKAKSKIIILLTDGQPTGKSSVTIDQAIKLAKQYKIKVYTMGIGNENGGYIEQFGRVMQLSGHEGGGVDKNLLTKISQETSGKFFTAHNPKQIREVYNTIDKLEKTKHVADVFSRYYEAFWLFAIPLLIALSLSTLLSKWLWRGLAW